MALANVSVVQADVEKFQPDIAQFLFSGQTFTDVVDFVKRDLERDIQLKGEIDDDDMSKVRDTSHKYLFDRIIQEVIAEVFLQNNLLEKAGFHRKRAESIPLRYYLDLDEDSTEDKSERDSVKPKFFGR